ncbi:MAG: chromate efflux transporter [Verrucomicrobia bacterium]|nr:chromate efflux transporter [Verrucomicrobiota bacterium]
MNMASSSNSDSPPPSAPSFGEAFRFWLKLGFISFGGPAGQISIMHEELVERRRWISEDRFLHALNYCMLLPGPEAQQLAIYIGWLLHRTLGGLVAGTLFVLPAALLLFGLSWSYVVFGKVAWVSAAFYGLKPAVLAIVVVAVLRIGNKALKNRVMGSIALVAFVAIAWLKVPFPLIILFAGALGWAGERWAKDSFLVIQGHGSKAGKTSVRSAVLDDSAEIPGHARPSWGRSLRVIALGLILWWAPVAGLALWLGADHATVQQGLFFSKAAMVTFGGAYAVLPYVAQQAVEKYAWLGPTQMLDGLALAESTPGPLIIVLQFVGFLGAWNQPGPLSPLGSATLGSFITTWTTFVPCFLWIFLGAPYIERIRGNQRLNCMLSTITAAVVGVVLNLAVWFGLHLLMPQPGQFEVYSAVVAVVAFVGLQYRKWPMIPVILGSALLGMVYRWMTAG